MSEQNEATAIELIQNALQSLGLKAVEGAKLLAIKQELRRRMHDPIVLVGAWLKHVVEG